MGKVILLLYISFLFRYTGLTLGKEISNIMYEVIDRTALKARARELMREGKVSPVKMSLLYFGIVFLMALALIIVALVNAFGHRSNVMVLPFLFLVVLIVLVDVVLSAGYICYCLGVWRGEQMPYSSLFDGFSFAGKIIGLQLVMALFVYLWSLLFIIPGIIAAYRYSFAMYNLCLNPELGVMEALELSKQQTRGYKMQLFVLELSFIGWALLVSLPQAIGQTLLELSYPSTGTAVFALILILVTAIGQVFLNPYMQLSYVGFYLRSTTPFANEEENDLPPPPEF